MQRVQQFRQNTLKVSQNVIVPEAENQEIIGRKPTIATDVGLRFRVLAANNFDDHAGGVTNKVGNERTDRNLPAKLEICESTVAQREPELVLRIGHSRSQRTGSSCGGSTSSGLGTLSPCGRGWTRA
jgi:hypothetical protein